ncbi:SRPBCC family protein [Halomicroarcula sp. F13]|uniref:SRPBCC family protein n=1 Tax=Haloarcula rubra TaxID=2487747 RepID=A0AAW4PR94_9EURY|nr:SRPBCC family protein [Halomicroarcula rubra]MBX0323659.1 SRPBCC family protein [Halomicroarcula rubra]
MAVSTVDDVWIAAPVSEVFAFMDEPTNQAAVTPSLRTAERIERRPNGGNRARYVYRMFGLSFEGEVVATTYDPDDRIVYEMRGDLTGTISWTFTPEDGGTRLTYAAEYDVPGPVPEFVVAPLVRWYNRREVAQLLADVRRRLEDDESVDRRAERASP